MYLYLGLCSHPPTAWPLLHSTLLCRYWTGKAPDWAVEQAGDETRLMPPSSSVPRASSGHAKADPRLLRLGQKQQQSQSGRRHATEAIIVQRQPAPVGGSTTGEANVDSAGKAVYERADEQDDDEIALRRLAIRSRQATESHGVHLDEEFQVWGQPFASLALYKQPVVSMLRFNV